MSEISTELIKEAVYELCFKANTCLNDGVYSKVLTAYENSSGSEKNILKSILQNAKIAHEKKMPLCQDTGQVIVFIEIGQNVKLVGGFLNDAINFAVEKCYIENFFRKSVVKNAIFDRKNTKTNTPTIIYTEIVEGDSVKINVLIKGAGSENKSVLHMMLPTSTEEEIVSSCGDLILKVGENACPPMFVGIGIGGTADKAALLSKQALVQDCMSSEEMDFAKKIKDYIIARAPKIFEKTFVLDLKIKSTSTHIACLPVSITINCHSDRFSSCIIENNNILYLHKVPDFVEIKSTEDKKEILTSDIEDMRNLKKDDEVLLTGEIYVARDMAHKRLIEMIDKKEELPFDLKNKIIFYAGPCPAKRNEVIGSVGPTTSSRMDKYAIYLYNLGLYATIGKGDRSSELEHLIRKNKARYFTVTGGVAALIAEKVKTSEVIMFEDLGAEAIYKLYVEKLPVKVSI